MPLIKKIAGFLLYTLVFIILVFAICETYARITYKRSTRIIPRAITVRLWNAWLAEEHDNPLVPPFKLYANKDLSPDRLKKIAETASLPANQTLTSYDFIRPKESRQETTYQVTVNSLGFRDPPRSVKKPERTVRIIALGSYQTFGEGVNDEETYCRQLEHILNSAGYEGLHFEVWNGGRLAGSAIVGLAMLKYKILDYDPDLLILDYGFVDSTIMGDDNMPLMARFSGSGPAGLLGKFLRLTKKMVVGKSAFFDQLTMFLHSRYAKENVESFSHVLWATLRFADEHGLPVILLRQTTEVFDEDYYRQYTDALDNVYFADGKVAFEWNPPSNEMVDAFYAGNNWMKDDGIGPQDPLPIDYREYHTNFFQYNKWGHLALAKYLAENIRNYLNEGVITPR